MDKTKSIYKRVLYIAIPMMLQSGITNAVGLVDNLMVGSLGTETMTAVSIVGQLMFVFNLAIFGGLSGPAIFGAQYYGQGNKEGFRNIFRLKVWIALGITLLGIAVFLLGNHHLIELYLQGSDDGFDKALTISSALKYMYIMLWGLLPFAVTQIYSGSLRESGESISPMVAGIVSVVVDIVLNYLLIFGKLGLPKMGVAGAALATAIARFAEMAVVVLWTHLGSKNEYMKKLYKTLKIPMRKMKNIIIKSLPIFLNEFLWAAGMAALTQCYSMRGLTIVAALNICNSINNLVNVVIISTGHSVGIVIGQLLGASEFDTARKYSLKLMRFAAIMCTFVGLILVALSFVIPRFFNTTDEVRHLGQMFIIITACYYPLQAYLNALYFTLRAGGKTVITFLFDSVYTWVIPVTVAFCLCKFSPLTIVWIYVIVLGLDFIKTSIGYVLIRSGIWVNNLVTE